MTYHWVLEIIQRGGGQLISQIAEAQTTRTPWALSQVL